MKKVAMLGPNLESPGGVNVAIKHLKKFFEKKGIEVHLFPVGKTNIKENEYIHPINTDIKKEQIRIFNDKFKKFNFNLVIANNLRTSFLLSSFSKNKSLNDLYVIHQGRILQNKFKWFHFKQKSKFKKIFTYKKIVLFNKCSKNSFINKYKINAQYFIIPNAFDFEEIKNKSNEFKVKGNYILGVGRLEKNKNYDYLLKAYAVSRIDKELWLLGDGEEKEFLKKLAKKLGIQNKVKFLGWQDNSYPYIKNASLLVHPSKFEALPTVIIESLILNTPVVATDIKCGPNEILTEELSEFLVPLNKVDILAEKIYKALENYPKIKDEYIEKYKLENVGKKYLEFLH